MIWLPRADQPLVFAQPASFSLGLLRRGSDLTLLFPGLRPDRRRRRGRRLASLGPPARERARGCGERGRDGERPREADPRRRRRPLGPRRRRAAASSLLTRGGETRRFPYWFRVSVPRLGSERPHAAAPPGRLPRRHARPARRASARTAIPSAPGPLGVTQRLAGPEQVFRFVIRGRVANAGAVVVSQAPGSHVSPRLVRAGSEDRLAGYTALPLRLNPYQPGYFAADPGRRRLPPRARCLRPRLRHDQPPRGRAASPSASGSTTPARPSVRLLTRTVTRGKLLLLSRARPRLGRRPLHPARASSTAASAASSGTRRTASSASGSRRLAPRQPQARLHRLRLPGGEEQRERERDAAEHAAL